MDETRPDCRVEPATFVLVPGAGGDAWYWHRLAAVLEARGHRPVPVDLPATDGSAGLQAYADTIVAATPRAGPSELVVVAQSMGGFSAPLVCERLDVRLLVLLNAMIPRPGETGGAWWEVTGQAAARDAMAVAEGRPTTDAVDPTEDFLHDLPDDLLAEAMDRGAPDQSARPFADPFPLERWPDVPTLVLAGADDRFFPVGFQRRVADDRLGVAPVVVPGGHLLALSHPEALADHLEAGLRWLGDEQEGASAGPTRRR